MAISSNNLFTDGFRGTVGGNMTFRKRKSGKVIVSRRRGSSDSPVTDHQLKIRDRFRLAIIYAKAVLNDPALKAAYAAVAGPDQSAYNMAMKDAFKAPQVHSIDTGGYSGKTGNYIMVRATDDFKVVSVKVSLHNTDGALLEEGNAVLQLSAIDWLYTATSANEQLAGTVITAIAKDLPGNESAKEIKL